MYSGTCTSFLLYIENWENGKRNGEVNRPINLRPNFVMAFIVSPEYGYVNYEINQYQIIFNISSYT